MSAQELLPCPFCGVSDHLSAIKTGSAAGHYYPYAVVCRHLDCDDVRGPTGNGKHEAIAAWNLRTPPAMSADHIGDADKMAHVLRGMVNRGTLIDAEAIDRALTLAVYRQDPDDDDRAWAASQAEVIGQLVVPVGSGDADKMGAPVEAAGWRDIANAPRDGTRFLAVMSGFEPEIHWWDVKIGWCVGEGIYRDPEHWQPLPPPPSAHPTPIKPSADTGELRERVTQIIEAAIERHNPGNAVRHTLDDADEILNLIQSERAG